MIIYISAFLFLSFLSPLSPPPSTQSQTSYLYLYKAHTPRLRPTTTVVPSNSCAVNQYYHYPGCRDCPAGYVSLAGSIQAHDCHGITCSVDAITIGGPVPSSAGLSFTDCNFLQKNYKAVCASGIVPYWGIVFGVYPGGTDQTSNLVFTGCTVVGVGYGCQFTKTENKPYGGQWFYCPSPVLP